MGFLVADLILPFEFLTGSTLFIGQTGIFTVLNDLQFVYYALKSRVMYRVLASRSCANLHSVSVKRCDPYKETDTKVG